MFLLFTLGLGKVIDAIIQTKEVTMCDDVTFFEKFHIILKKENPWNLLVSMKFPLPTLAYPPVTFTSPRIRRETN